MKKYIAAAAAAAVLSLTLTVPAFAGTWKSDDSGWWYENDDGSTASYGWNWINDRCYFFDEDGYCMMDMFTPDGYQVDESGAWVINGMIQTQSGAQIKSASVEADEVGEDKVAAAKANAGSGAAASSGTTTGTLTGYIDLVNGNYYLFSDTVASYDASGRLAVSEQQYRLYDANGSARTSSTNPGWNSQYDDTVKIQGTIYTDSNGAKAIKITSITAEE